jgi:hypothetical protein
MINLVHAVVILMQSQGAHVENVIADKLGLTVLLRAHGTACSTAMDLLRGLLKKGSVPLTGKCQGESSRRVVTILELQNYYIDIGASELSCPPGGVASDFPKITGLRINEAELAREAAKIRPKTKANRLAACTACRSRARRLRSSRSSPKRRQPITSLSASGPSLFQWQFVARCIGLDR